MNEKIAYQLETDKPFATVIENLEAKAPRHQFRVLAVHDVQQTLAEKGLQRGPLKIIEVCNARFAYQALQKQSDVALFMPCRYAVHTEGGKTVVKLSRPTLMAEMIPGADLETLATEVEATLIKVMKESV